MFIILNTFWTISLKNVKILSCAQIGALLFMEYDRNSKLFLPDHLKYQLAGYLRGVQPQITHRMDEIGMLPPHFDSSITEHFVDQRIREAMGRGEFIVKRSNEAALLWHGPSLSADRAREEERNPEVASYMINCIDGRILRALDGHIHSTKSEKAQIGIAMDPSSGLLVPSGPEIRSSIENRTKKALQFVRVHDHCLAMGGFLEEANDSLWNLLPPGDARLVRQASFISQEHANLVLAELATRRPMEDYYQQVHGLEEPERMSVVTLFNIKRTSLEFINPLLIPTGDGGFRLAGQSEQKNFTTSKITEMLRRIQGEVQSPHIPEYGKYQYKYIVPDVFEEFSRTLTNLWIGLSEGKIRTEDEQEVALSPQFSIIRKYVENSARSLYPDLDKERLAAVVDKMMRAGAREYLLKESGNDDHKEICMAGARGSDYVTKYITAAQTLRMGLNDDEEITEKRVELGSAVMNGHEFDPRVLNIRSQHLLFLSDLTTAGVLDLFRFVGRQKGIRNLIDRGQVLPIPVRVTSNIVINSIVQEAARELYNPLAA
jgi:hypothetical protein